MKYMLLIHQGTTPTPGTDGWENLSQEEQNEVYAPIRRSPDPRVHPRSSDA